MVDKWAVQKDVVMVSTMVLIAVFELAVSLGSVKVEK